MVVEEYTFNTYTWGEEQTKYDISMHIVDSYCGQTLLKPEDRRFSLTCEGVLYMDLQEDRRYEQREHAATPNSDIPGRNRSSRTQDGRSQSFCLDQNKQEVPERYDFWILWPLPSATTRVRGQTGKPCFQCLFLPSTLRAHTGSQALMESQDTLQSHRHAF